MSTPILSICVPSRNRQRYFKETIAFLLDSPRQDVEYVFADNSDDPTVMNDFMRAHVGDARLRYLPSAGRVLSMQDNWERALEATTGDWVSVIGDDDLIDPDLIDALQTACSLKPGLEAFAWANLRYSWVSEDSRPHNVSIPMATSFHDMPQSMVYRRAFRWDDAGVSITSGFSVYHAAISRRLLTRVRARFGDRYFGHPTIDYDNALKNAALGKAFVFCQRPFSIFGACPESNSAAVWNPKLLAESNRRFMEELGRDYDQDPWMRDFPFHSLLGLPAIVAQVQQWLRVTHGIGMDGWEANFTRACATYCGTFAQRDDFDGVAESYRQVFRTWKGGAFLRCFNPVHVASVTGDIFTGLNNANLYVSDRIGGATSPAGFYRAANGLMERPADLVGELRSAGKEQALLNKIDPISKVG